MLTNYIAVQYEAKGERYLRSDTGDEVKFPKLVRVLFKHEETDAKLSYTRAVDGCPTERAVPCIRIDGVKHMLDSEDIEVAEDCLLAA